PVAVGIYLPISTSATIFVGGVVRALIGWISRGRGPESLTEEETGKGVLLASGLIAGGAIGGLVVAISRVVAETAKDAPGRGEEILGIAGATWVSTGAWANVIALVIFAGLVAFLYSVARRKAA